MATKFQMISNRYETPASARYLPFACFMAFIGLEEGLRFLAGKGLFILTDAALYYLYPVKVFTVACLLYRYRTVYHELSLKDFRNLPLTFAALGAGMFVFILWIHMDWTLTTSVSPAGFNPTILPDGAVQLVMTLFRVAGAILVVPLMEELFWRSFLLRYLVDSDFEKVPMGHFSWLSFLLTVVLFGLEHHFILAGMAAGIVYNVIIYQTRSLAQCVLAHAVTNLALAVYVLTTAKWHFW